LHRVRTAAAADKVNAAVPVVCGALTVTLLAYGIGLWDVVARAYRPGSLDSNIRQRDDNDLLGLLLRHTNIKAIAFNGGTAGRLGRKVLGAQATVYQIVELPSSSPTYTLHYVEKTVRWQALRAFLAA
jgi:hypoxanthine-DNA glycosylase